MLKLIKRCPEFVPGYKDYCQEFFDHQVKFFVPTDPQKIDDTWFERTKSWYDRKEAGEIAGQPRSLHFWAVDGETFVGEFQLRTELTPAVIRGIGSIGFAVRVSLQGQGYGSEILRQGLEIAKEQGLDKVLFNVNEANAVSCHLCEKVGAKLLDSIPAFSKAEGQYQMRQYWLALK